LSMGSRSSHSCLSLISAHHKSGNGSDDMLTVKGGNRSFGGHHAVSAQGLNLRHSKLGHHVIAGNKWPGIFKFLVAVHNSRKIYASSGVLEQLLQGGILQNNGESRRSDYIGKSQALGVFDIVMEAIVSEDRIGEFSNFFSSDAICGGGFEHHIN
jgi:hypothetical protein